MAETELRIPTDYDLDNMYDCLNYLDDIQYMLPQEESDIVYEAYKIISNLYDKYNTL